MSIEEVKRYQYTFIGGVALSSFRLCQLLENSRKVNTNITGIATQFVIFVETSKELHNQEDLKKIGQILSATLLPEEKIKDVVNELIVVPRFGTQSPWSSKSTNIVQNCGLDWCIRIERGTRYKFELNEKSSLDKKDIIGLGPLVHDKMTEIVLNNFENCKNLFQHFPAKPLETIPIMEGKREALEKYNKKQGLALSNEDIEYLLTNGIDVLKRDYSDVELMMFAQVNSEHCRHKIFNADFTIDNKKKELSLFSMIRNTYKTTPEGILSAYSDNASVIEGKKGTKLFVDPKTQEYTKKVENGHILMKVETHNHPTGISPFPGAATGSGGEIRDEGAVGRGSKPKAGLVGFSTSHLRIPGHLREWETFSEKSPRQASALDIMTQGPLGGAAFNNEFGRPCLTGYFRTMTIEYNQMWGYHKPIMIAGGLGNIREEHVEKGKISDGALLIALGGPAMLIGLGGGAASSVDSGGNCEDLDFASVQRHNPEMQRRAQEVIDVCCSYGAENPIESIHDVGAGGLSNAFPELVHDSNMGGVFDIKNIPSADSSLSPMEIWCNESQERYVLAIKPTSLSLFDAICKRERAIYGVIGHATSEQRVTLNDTRDLTFDHSSLPSSTTTKLASKTTTAIDLPSEVLFGKPPKMHRHVTSEFRTHTKTELYLTLELEECCRRLLLFPTIASKSFLITIGDRSVTGLVHRDQMVGAWQTPVADVGVTCTGYGHDYHGEAMAMGERTPTAVISSGAAARMAVSEALLNLHAANIKSLKDIRLSANWMASCGSPGQDSALYEAVETIGMEICPALGIAIPVGKDSLSMRSKWESEGGKERQVTAPVSLIITAFAPVENVKLTLTPTVRNCSDTVLLFCCLDFDNQRLGCSSLSQVFNDLFMDVVPDVDIKGLKNFIECFQSLRNEEPDNVMAYHDRSDGGLFITLTEMAFASRCGLDITIPENENCIKFLFNEEVGFVVQVSKNKADYFIKSFAEVGCCAAVVATPNFSKKEITIKQGKETLLNKTLQEYLGLWYETSYLMQKQRDNPACAMAEFDSLLDVSNPGLSSTLTFDIVHNYQLLNVTDSKRPKVAILREQGVNGHIEMANAFEMAGFDCVDVHMSDIISKNMSLSSFSGLACCGGFSYGDVLGAGNGWAKSIAFNDFARKQFEEYFNRKDTFTLGVCNGCQMLTSLATLIPGTEDWPIIKRNISEQFEARVCMVEIQKSNSIFFSSMEGSQLPIAVAHGEGRVVFKNDESKVAFENKGLSSMVYVDNYGKVTESYPANPNGSPDGITGFSNLDGRVMALMPHPERVTRSYCNSYTPKGWDSDNSPWLQMFINARKWIDSIN